MKADFNFHYEYTEEVLYSRLRVWYKRKEVNQVKQETSDKQFFKKQMEDLKTVFHQWVQCELTNDVYQQAMEQIFQETTPEVERTFGYKF